MSLYSLIWDLVVEQWKHDIIYGTDRINYAEELLLNLKYQMKGGKK